MKPLVSIILPAYNCAHFISRAIDSVLAQSFTEWELLIIDDGSTDGTGTVGQSYTTKDQRIKVISNQGNKGVQYSLKRGLELATGEYIARIDADDSWVSTEKLTEQVNVMRAHPEYVLVGTGAIIVTRDGDELLRFLPPQTDEAIRARLLMKNCFMHASVLFRRSVALEVGGYDQTEATKHIEDYDLWLKLGTMGKLMNLPLYGLLFTSWPMTVSAQNRSMQFKRTIALIKRYRKQYPAYWKGISIAYMRYWGYGVYSLLPARFRHAFLKRYKQL